MAHRPKGSVAPPIADAGTQALERFIARLVKNGEDAKDLAQEAHLKALVSDPAKHAEQPVRYLYAIARNLAFRFMASKRSAAVTYDSDVADDAATRLAASDKDVCEQLISEEQLEAVLEGMPEDFRRILLMQRRDGLSHKQIAERLGRPLETVKKYAVRARAYARKQQWK